MLEWLKTEFPVSFQVSFAIPDTGDADDGQPVTGEPIESLLNVAPSQSQYRDVRSQFFSVFAVFGKRDSR